MARNLKQKSFGRSIESSIDDAGLVQKIVTSSGESEYHFTYEEITTERVSFKEENTTIFAIAIAFGCMSGFGILITLSEAFRYQLLNLFLIIPTIGLFIYYLKAKKHKIHLFTTRNRVIEFFSNAQEKEEVKQFIEELLNQRNIFLFEKYGQPTRNLDYAQQLANLNWLLNSRAITKPQYDEKLQLLNSLFNINTPSKPIGFAANT